MKISDGAYVLFFYQASKNWLTKVEKGKKLHTHIGIITGLKSGSNVLEIGTGSASLTTFFASLVEPGGHVFTYDVNEEFMEIANKNLKKSGMEKNVTMLNHDIMKEELEHSNADVAIIDLGDRW